MIGEYNYGTGRRKTSVARVFIRRGTGKILINGRELDQFFARQSGQMIVKQPLAIADALDSLTFASMSTAVANQVRPAPCVMASPAP